MTTGIDFEELDLREEPSRIWTSYIGADGNQVTGGCTGSDECSLGCTEVCTSNRTRCC